MKYLESTYKIVSYIEDNLDKAIYLDDIIKFTYISKFHYIRSFKALTGTTLNEYIRRRKLSQAAFQLVETKKSIIDIAVVYGYESQEAFTRAFKEMYGFTPKVYRKNKRHLANLDQVVFNEAVLTQKLGEEELKPIFVKRKAMNIIGMKYCGNNENREIPKLWSQFALRVNEIKNIINASNSYGYETYSEASKATGNFTYVAGVEVAGQAVVPPGMVSIKIPANQYAAFSISAILEDVPKTIKRIYSKLLLELNLEPGDGYDFQFFDETFIPNDYDSKHYLYIPLKHSVIAEKWGGGNGD
ncbi:MAG: Transcription activator effector binding (Modular protein) [Firmicutes bacterium]|nr:Transcription activator effector binding (Modular protein) [Bacillota bacterium]